LRNFIECVRTVADSSEDIDDFGAAITGLQDYADDTAMALDAGAIAQRAVAIEREEAAVLRLEAASTDVIATS
jgi:hypothetical protein